MGVFIWSVILIISLIVLVKSADYFTDYSEKLGLLLGISPFIIGVTIISIGTSLPELLTGLVSIFSDVATDPTIFVEDNIIGSNISNIFLVIGISSAIAGVIIIKKDVMRDDFPILLISALYLFFIASDGHIGRFEALIGLIGYITYMWYSIASNREDKGLVKELTHHPSKNWKVLYPVIIAISATTLYFGAEWTVRSVFEIAAHINLPSSIITIIVVALGTSLPELVVSARAAFKKSFEISIGNIIGSNIFNTFAITGITGLITPLTISSQSMVVAMPFMLGATFVFLVSCLSKSISRYVGIGFLCLYVIFVLQLVQTI